VIDVISRSADLSPCGRYRYRLSRTLLLGKGTVLFVLLNPSTADGLQDDQTVRQCIGFTEHWSYNRLVIVNLFPFRATMPRDMLQEIDPLGFHADDWILRAAQGADLIVCAWGAHGRHRGRGEQVRHLLTDRAYKLHHLGLTENGQPRHPLYLKRETPLQEWH
jgi:hypothetical protein